MSFLAATDNLQAILNLQPDRNNLKYGFTGTLVSWTIQWCMMLRCKGTGERESSNHTYVGWESEAVRYSTVSLLALLYLNL